MGGSYFGIDWRNFPRGRRFRRKTSSAQSSTTTIDSPGPSNSPLSVFDARSAASFEVYRGERRLKTPVNGVSAASRSNIEVRNSIARPSESIENPSAITPPIANILGWSLPFINLEYTPGEALTSGISPGNSLIPSSTRGATVATATIAIELSTLWGQAVDRLAEEDRESIPKPGDGINLVKSFIGEVERKQEECNKKRWFYTNSRGKNVFLLDGLVTQLNKYATIGDLAIQHHPDIVALAWSGFRFLLQVGTAYTQDMQTASESLEYLLRIIFCCEIYEKLYGTRKGLGTVQQLNTSLVELYVSILKYLCYIQKYLNKNTGGRVLESFASDLKVLLKDVQQKESSVLLDTDKVEKEASAKERTDAAKERTEAARARAELAKELDEAKKERAQAKEEVEKFGKERDEAEKERAEAAKARDQAEKERAEAAKARDQAANARNQRKEVADRLKNQLQSLSEPLENIQNLTKKVYEAMEGDKKLKVLNWLSDMKFMDHHAFSRQRRQENTGLWLEENEVYKEWKNSKSSSLLWLRGDAGYGKTTLVSYVIDELKAQAKSNEKILAYFYCNYKEDSRRRPETVLRTLVKQFCLKSPGDPTFVPIPVSSIYMERENHGHASGELQCQESTALIIDLSKMYHQVTIIVDALDECYEETRRDLFLSLTTIVKSGSNVKVFLASRFEQDIARMFEGYKCHYIQASDNTKDINHYIDRQLDIRCDLQKCGTEELLLDGDVDDVLKEEISRTLKEKANGMFMWVNLQILALCEEPTANCVREALKKLPRDLKATYDLIIERTEARQSSSRIAKSVLSLLLSAQEPCSLSTILQALAVGPGSNDFDPGVLKLPLSRILDCCKNLAVDDRNTQNLRFAHFSVQEYLLSNPKFNDGATNHTTMAEICLKVLLSHHSKSKCHLGDFMKYATKHWAAHLRLAGTVPQTSVLYKYCMEFLKPSTAYENWVSTVEEEGDPFKAPNTRFVSPFWVACYYQLYDFLNVDTRSEEILNELNQNEGRTPLSWAAGKGHDKVVELLLRDSRTDVNISDNTYNQTPLSWAAENGHYKVVELLLRDRRTDFNKTNMDGRTPLSWAAVKGHDVIVELFMKGSGIDVNLADNHRRTPLSWAAEKGHDKVVTLILRNSGTDVNIKDGKRRTPLSWAAEKGHDEVVELLLPYSRAYINLSDNIHHQTPLSWAAEKGHDKVVELLLRDSSTDVNISDNDYNQTPLSWAAEKGHYKVVELLLGDRRTDFNKANMDGRTPLSWAATKGDDKMVELFLQGSGIDVNRADNHSRTPLSRAAEKGHDKVVRLLLRDSRTDVSLTDLKRRSPLSFAAEKGHDEVVGLLLQDSRAGVDLANMNGRTSLSFAAEKGHYKVVELLLRDGRTDVNIRDNRYNRTPLSWAAMNGLDKVVELLVTDSRIDINTVDKNGVSALLLAQRNEHGKVVQLLSAAHGLKRS